jgi:predicted ATPase
MLREMAEAIEVGTMRRPLVLILEDLHWSDHSTLELLAYLARRRQHARLFIIATYRPSDVVLRAHPLKEIKQELQAHGQCAELRLELLTQEDITEYLARRFPGSALGNELAQEVYEHTEGNPLFMVNVVEEFLRQGVIVEQGGCWVLTRDVTHASVPDTLRQLIEKQIAQLGEDERRVLEVASVAGAEFTVAAVATALKQDIDEVETICEEVAGQGHFLEERGIAEWPDGAMSGCYGFRHALYQNVLYDRIAEARRVRLHRLIGERLETGYGVRVGEIAAELAVHFERGREYQRAVRYLEQAGKNAVQRSAHREAIAHLTKGLELLKTLPDTPERRRQELALHIALGPALMATRGFAVPEVEKSFARARELCEQIGETPQLFPVLVGISSFYLLRGKLQIARELREQLLELAQATHDPTRLLEAHNSLGVSLFFLGEFSPARVHFEQSLTFYDPQQHSPQVFLHRQDPSVICYTYLAITLWYLGYPQQALERAQQALTRAQELSHPFSLALAFTFTSMLHHYRREARTTQELAEAAIALCTQQGFPLFLAMGTFYRGWALAEQGQDKEGIAQIRQGLAAFRATGQETAQPHYLMLLAEAYGKEGQTEEGLRVLTEALTMAEKNGERSREAELYRLKGELTLQSSVQRLGSSVKTSQKLKVKSRKSSIPNTQPLTPNPQVEAEACFLRAIEIARRQQAKSLELRAAMSLVRLRQQQATQHGSRNTHYVTRTTRHETRARLDAARTMLSEIYNWFTEGFDTKDLQEAKALLEELQR